MATLTIARAHDAAGNPTPGSLVFDDGTAPISFNADVTVSVAPGNLVVYNQGAAVSLPAGVTTAGGLSSIAANTFAGVPGGGFIGAVDLSQDVYKDLINIGTVSDKPDPHTGNLYMVGFHHGAHVVHGQHVGTGAVGRRHTNKHHQTRHHHKDVVLSITAGTTATLTWSAGALTDNNGTTIATIPAGTSGLTVTINQILYFNGTTYAVCAPNAIDFNADTSIGYYVVGHFSATTDSSGYLTLYGWHGGLVQIGSGQIRNGAVTRKHLNKHHVTRGHFVNCTFQLSGGSGINTPLFSLVAHSSGHIYFVPDDGTGNIDLGTGSVGVVGPPWPLQSGVPNCQGCIILYNDQTTSNANAFCAVSSSTDLTNDTATINGLPASQWMKIGHISWDPDPVTGNYIFHSYLTGTHHNTSVHHAPKSHTRSHSHVHNPHKHHHHGTSFECIGTTFFANYTTGGVTPTFTSTIQSSDGESYVLQPATFTVVAHDWVYVDISGVANGGNVTPTHANSSSFTPGNNHIVLCRISGSTDANGDLTTEGHHHNAHKKSPHHLKNNIVKSAHISSGAVLSTHIGSGQVNSGHLAVTAGYLSPQYTVSGLTANQTSFAPAAGSNSPTWKVTGGEQYIQCQIAGNNGVFGSWTPIKIWNTPAQGTPDIGVGAKSLQYQVLAGDGTAVVFNAFTLNSNGTATFTWYYSTAASTTQLTFAFKMTGVT